MIIANSALSASLAIYHSYPTRARGIIVKYTMALEERFMSILELPIYNFSRCYCKIVLCWYVDSLACRLRNYAK